MLRLRDGFHLTATAIVSRPLRSLLTLLGVAIGIAAVTLLTAIGEGLRAYVLDSFSQFGTRIVAVHPGKTQTGGMGGLLGSMRPLTRADAEALRQLPHIEALVPVIQGNADIKYQQLTRRSDVIGGGYQLAEAWRFKMALGSFLPQARDGRSPPYAVLGAKLHRELFGGDSPLGELIRIGDTRFRVIGVMEEKGQMLGFDLDEVAYIPVDWAESLFNREGLMEIDVVFNAGTTSAAMARRIKALLQERHGAEDFSITTQDDMLASLDRILGTLSIAIGALGGISPAGRRGRHPHHHDHHRHRAHRRNRPAAGDRRQSAAGTRAVPRRSHTVITGRWGAGLAAHGAVTGRAASGLAENAAGDPAGVPAGVINAVRRDRHSCRAGAGA